MFEHVDDGDIPDVTAMYPNMASSDVLTWALLENEFGECDTDCSAGGVGGEGRERYVMHVQKRTVALCASECISDIDSRS